MLSHVFLDLRGVYLVLAYTHSLMLSHTLILCFLLHYHVLVLFLRFPGYVFLTVVLCRPHDRVPLREMKNDWHSCLDNPVGFKVSFILMPIKFFLSLLQTNQVTCSLFILDKMNKKNYVILFF